MGRPDVPSREEYLRGWSRLHGDIDPHDSRLVAGWLSLVYVLASPLARLGASPSAVSVAGLLLTCAAVPLAASGQGGVAAAGLVVLLAGAMDSLDGAVAVLTGRASRWGAVLDAVLDRLSEIVALSALVVAGGPVELAVLAGGAGWLLEYVRSRAGERGIDMDGVLTPAERPTRVLVVGMSLLAAAARPDEAETWLWLGAAALLAVSVLGAGMLMAAAWRRGRQAEDAHGG